MATGAIAYQDLIASGDSTVIARTVATLKQSPGYNSAAESVVPNWLQGMKESRISAGTPDEALYLFMMAARWADDIRGTGMHCGGCHYINYRFTPGHGTGRPEAVPQDPNIETAFSSHSALLAAAGEATPKRATALSWVFHLVGDVHMPLHAAALFTRQRPDGDRGGNDFYVRAIPGGEIVNLHTYWDGLLIGRESFQSVRTRAAEMRTRHPRSSLTTELHTTDFQQWSHRESYRAAVHYAYLGGGLKGALPRNPPLVANGRKNYYPADAPVLPRGYAGMARNQAYRRGALAGYRLADLLRLWFRD